MIVLILAFGLAFGFAIMAIVLVIISFFKGTRVLSGQVVPLQQLHELFNPGQQNMLEIVEERKKQQDESGEDKD